MRERMTDAEREVQVLDVAVAEARRVLALPVTTAAERREQTLAIMDAAVLGARADYLRSLSGGAR